MAVPKIINKTAVTRKEIKELLSEHFWVHSFLVAKYATGFLQLHHRTASQTARLCTDSGVFLLTWCCMPFLAFSFLSGCCVPLWIHYWHTLTQSWANSTKEHATDFTPRQVLYTNIKQSCSRVSCSWVLYNTFYCPFLHSRLPALLSLTSISIKACLLAEGLHVFGLMLPIIYSLALWHLESASTLLSFRRPPETFRIFWWNLLEQVHTTFSTVDFCSAFTFEACFYNSTYKTIMLPGLNELVRNAECHIFDENIRAVCRQEKGQHNMQAFLHAHSTISEPSLLMSTLWIYS